MKNIYITIKNLVLDKSFQLWVLKPNPETEAYWKTWLQKHPQHSEMVAQAREIVLLLEFNNDTTANQDFVDVWSKIQQSIKTPTYNYSQYLKIASILVGILLLIPAYFLYHNHVDEVTYSSGYSEIKHILLPDSSRVTLNGNSQLRLSKSEWENSKNRNVFLEGEAFFEVKHININGKSRKFLVYTNEVEIEVLGTEFNVNSRRLETKVILNSGKVQLKIPQESTTSKLVMKPGDLVTFDKEQGNTVINHTENPELLTSWRKNRLVFDEVSLNEISQILNDNYGLRVHFANDSLKEKRFRGTFLADDIDILKKTLMQAYDIKITKSNRKK